ncbi:MAG: nucleoid-associated protein [Cyclobacteriaceae bacterium]|nr:nucleoid-associated protein [Cyclobacteriaceae bacterium]
MKHFADAVITALSVHYVGNKIQDEALQLSESMPDLDDQILKLLKSFFTKGFKDSMTFTFSHHSDLSNNIVYQQVKRIFNDKNELLDASRLLARELFETSDHPNIKSGEFYTVYFEDCSFGDETTSAIGLFKSENKETFIKVYSKGSSYEIEQDEGIRINRLDKGCIIFNVSEEDGYRILMTDHTNPSQEAQYWKEKYLHLKPWADVYYHTVNYMQLCRDFVVESFPEAPKSDKLSLMHESESYFKNEPSFDKISFHEKVLKEPEIIDAFESYKQDYVKNRDIEIVDEFEVSQQGVKNMKKHFKSVIKLDKNFHIYIHGNRERIEKGFDASKGMHFYQLFFDSES